VETYCIGLLELSPARKLQSWTGLQKYTLCLKKDPTFKLSVTLSNVTRFSEFLHFGKRTKFAIKPIRHYPSHPRHVATLPWEIKNANVLQIFGICGRKCKQIAFIVSTFIIHAWISIFLVFKIASFPPYLVQIKFSMSLFLHLFTFAINLWHWKFVTADITAVFVNNQHFIQWREQDFDKNTYIHSAYTVIHM